MNHLQRVLNPTDTDSSHGDFLLDSDLNVFLDATELDMGEQSCTTISNKVSGLSDNDPVNYRYLTEFALKLSFFESVAIILT